MAEETRDLPDDPLAPGLARRFVAACCERWRVPSESCEVAELLTSELVTNAVLHGTGHIQLRVAHEHTELRVEVRDDSPRRPVPRPLRPYSHDGRGLALVETLSSGWGVADELPGKTVWFELTP